MFLCHRLIIRKSPEFTIYNANDFFSKAIGEVLSFGEDFVVDIEQSQNIFEEIYSARSVEKLLITISYTNSDDIGDDATEWVDDELRESQSKKVILQFESNHNQSINLKNKLVKGALGLAVENGEAEAIIYDNENRRRKIITKEHPNEIRTSAGNEDEIKNVIFMQIIDKYRNESRTSTTD